MRPKFVSRILAAATVAAACSSAQAVPVVVDLSNENPTSGVINGALFEWVSNQSTGTGVLYPFLSVKSDKGVTEGFNTDALDQLDNARSGAPSTNSGWTRSLLHSMVPIVEKGGQSFYQLLLDVNEPGGSKSLISLSGLKVYRTDDATLTNAARLSLTALWDMDAQGDSRVELNSRLNSGSGSGDMFAYIPTAGILGASGQYFVLYSQFGTPNPADAGGFEEWSILQGQNPPPPPPPIPEPETYALMLVGLGAVGLMARRRKARGG